MPLRSLPITCSTRIYTLLSQMKPKGREHEQDRRAQHSATSYNGISTDNRVMKLMML